MQNNRQSRKTPIILTISTLFMLLAVLPTHADDNNAVFNDSDALGRYGDENDEEVIEESTDDTILSSKPANAVSTFTATQNAASSSVIVGDNSNKDNESGYGDNKEDDGDV